MLAFAQRRLPGARWLAYCLARDVFGPRRLAIASYREGTGWPDTGVYKGRAAALERMQSLIELVGPIEVRIDDLIDLGDGRLIACVRMLGESATSDTPYTQTFAVVQRLRDGR